MTIQSLLVKQNWAKAGNAYVGDSPEGSGLLFTPTFLLDAENAPIGSIFQGSGSDQWTSDSSRTYGSTAQVFEGSKSFEMTCPQFFTGFGAFGGIKNFGTPLGKGDSVHSQVSVFFPSGSFDFNESWPHLKFLRYRTESAEGNNEGYSDIYIEDTDGNVKYIHEIGTPWNYSNTYMQYDTWETFEFRVDFDDVALDSGGTGRARVWHNKNGVMTLIIDVTDYPTLTTSTSVCPALYLFTYFNVQNGGSEPTTDQTCYVDRVVIETDTSKLVETDANGYKIIGGVS